MSDMPGPFGDDTLALAVLLHLAAQLKGLKEGDFKSGFESAIEEGGAYVDGNAGDGGTQMQTLMQQVIGLVNGDYALIDFVGKHHPDLHAAARQARAREHRATCPMCGGSGRRPVAAGGEG